MPGKNLAIREEVEELMKAEPFGSFNSRNEFLMWVPSNTHREEADQEKTTFITEYGLYCWKRMVNAIFSDQIGRNMEIYMDDMLVKSKKSTEHLVDLEETLQSWKKADCASILKNVILEFDPTRKKGGTPTLIGCNRGSREQSTRKRRSRGAEANILSRDPQESQGYIPELPERPRWTLYVDGARNPKVSGAGILIQGPAGLRFEYALRFSFKTTNNKVEYEAMATILLLA
ncbi:hypothetical protein LIER_26994 [Lithospermum erythrorhizon]|uniref:RNase H type-1 domain-containing protein n=1 Tax=Lithospermum erythrorhizon TaxID=34254 RepID=A0AAV3RC05_LITER